MTKQLLVAVCLALTACGPKAVPPAASDSTASVTPSATPSPSATATAGATPSPTPSPTSSPTLAPNALTVSPTTLSLTQTGSQMLVVTEAGYRGAYTVASSATGVVTVTSPVPSTANSTPITIDAVAAGSASVTVTDAFGQFVTVPVTVTITPVTIQARGAQR